MGDMAGSPDDDPADAGPWEVRAAPSWAGELPDGFEVLRAVRPAVRAAILAAVPEDARLLVAHLAAEGTPRAWALAHGLAIPAAVEACRRVEALLPAAIAQAYTDLGPMGAADDRLVSAWIEARKVQASA